MPRVARQRSCADIYHVILRGNNKQIIFEDKEDYIEFLEVMKFYKQECGYTLYAYCLMDNHIHLCIGAELEELEKIMKRIEVKYVRWYNNKYERCGHLFQERFKCEPVNDEKYFLTLIRYIHQNPTKAKITEVPSEYPWSSYRDYLSSNKEFVDVERVLAYFQTYDQFKEFMEHASKDRCMEYYASKRMPDDIAKEIALEVTGLNSLTDISKQSLLQRNRLLKEMKQNGFSIRQISRLTGISLKVLSAIK